MKKLHILLTVVYLGLLGCGGEKTQAADAGQPGKVLRVNDYEFIFNDQPGRNITFSTAKVNECTLTFAKPSFAKNFTATVKLAENGQLDLSCLTDTGLYILNDSQQTSASVHIQELSPEKATIVVEGYLYAVRKKDHLKLDKVVLNLSAEEVKLLQQ